MNRSEQRVILYNRDIIRQKNFDRCRSHFKRKENESSWKMIFDNLAIFYFYLSANESKPMIKALSFVEAHRATLTYIYRILKTVIISG